MASGEATVNGSGYVPEYTIPPASSFDDAAANLIVPSHTSASAVETAIETAPSDFQLAAPAGEATPASASTAGPGTNG
ncbi:hypothetical protein CRG98_022926, partial [Punica granatum]